MAASVVKRISTIHQAASTAFCSLYATGRCMDLSRSSSLGQELTLSEGWCVRLQY